MTAVTDKDTQNLTGRELLIHIREEKERMKKEGVIKNQPRFSPVSDEERPYDLPLEWEWVRLGDISSIIMGQSPKGDTVHETNNGDIEFHQGKTNFGKRYLFPSGKFASVPKKVSPANSILISMRAPVGTLNITERPIAVGRGLASIRPIGDISLLFLYHTMSAFESDLKKFATGSTFEAITGEVLANLLLPLPPLYLQQEIVDRLEKAGESQNMIEELSKTKMKETIKYRQAILQEAMRGELVEQNLEEGNGQELFASIQLKRQKKQTLSPVEEKEKIYEVPNNWTWVRLGEIGETSTGKTPSKKEFSTNSSRGFLPFVRSNHMNKGEIRGVEEFVTSSRTVPPNSVMMVCIGDIGRACITKEESAFNQQINAISNIKVETKFVYYQLISEYFISEATRRSGQTTIKIINKTKWESIPIVLPPLKEQKRIVEKLDAIMAVCDRLEEELETTKSEAEKWYRAVLQEAFQPEVK